MADKNTKREIGARLKEFRRSLRYSQKDFAKELQWDVNTYRKIEAGISMLTAEKAQKLYDKYELDINYVLEGKRMTVEEFLEQVWKKESIEMKKEMVLRLSEYVEKLL